MLMTIRDKAQGWIAWAIVILISIPFALWGIQEYLGVGKEAIVAKVNDHEITERQVEKGAFELRNNLRQRLGAQYNAEMFEESLLRKQVLENIIRDSLVQQATTDLGLRASDMMVRSTILSIPAFQVNGQFDQESYKRAVAMQGMSEQGFEESLRNSLVARQLEMAVQNSDFVTESFASDYEKLSGQQRKVRYLTAPTSIVGNYVEPSAEAIQSYYDQNKAAFMAPERVKLEYLQLNLENISKTLTASESELKTYYEQHKSEFIAPDKKRISHILFELPETASDEALADAMQKVLDIKNQLADGADFAELAKTNSQDIASAEAGGDLGILETGLYDKAFEEAAQALALDEISEPVRTPFGLHLIKVTELTKGDEDDFNAVADQVKTAFLKTEAEQVFFDHAEQLSNLAYETPDSLLPAAEALRMTIQKTDWITREGGDGMLSDPKVTGAAFSEEAITQGYNSEALELSPTDIVILRVTDHEAAAVKPLDTVRETIIAQLKDKVAFEKLENKVNEMLAELTEGKADLAAVAEQHGLGVIDAGFIGRQAVNVPFAVKTQVFRMNAPDSEKPVYTSVILGQDRIAIVALDEVKDGDASKANDQTRALLASQQGNDLYQLYIQSLKQGADIKYFNQAN